ncbi:MAG: diaminopimelate decarboxylase [Colwellia sp.]|nr:diaminopimelate decarboxylase [Colwellia sp.]
MPLSSSFEGRLVPNLNAIAQEFGTPFHIYDETGIRETCRQFKTLGDAGSFRQYYAVKALPNPHILQILYEEGMGFDCASVPEVNVAQQVGAQGEDIFFTSNNTQDFEFDVARAAGAILNLDDICFLDTLRPFPDLACFRISVGGLDRQCEFMGLPEESKFGVRIDQLEAAYTRARDLGATRFGIHAMLCSNECDVNRALELVEVILSRSAELAATLGLTFEFINVGGGIGIPYRPDDTAFDFGHFAAELPKLKAKYVGSETAIFMECGRYVTGPHGVLVTRVTNIMEKWRTMIGVDTGMNALMRPALYSTAYHHITLPFSGGMPVTADVVGSLCENNDKLAIQRELPMPERGDLMMIHDTGAHAGSMGFTYNGRLRPQELILRTSGRVEQIRRAETSGDYFATIIGPQASAAAHL